MLRTRALIWLAMLPATIAVAKAAHAADDAARLRQVQQMFRGYHKQLRGAPSISAAKLQQELRRRDRPAPLLVDVRTPAEQRVSMIPGAITQEAFERQATRYRGRHVVAYCTIGYRSGLFVKKLRARGVHADNLAGGILAWVHAGQPLVHDGKPTTRLHVYGKRWDLAPARIRTVW